MPILAFGTFRLDTHALELSHGGRKVRIRPQPCRLLVLLASRPGQLITREELQAALWPGVSVRFDLGLNSCLEQIRAALAESAVAPRYVETLSRRGYRFIAEVSSRGHAGGGLDEDDSCADGGLMAVALLCALPAAAQAQTGDITGRVLDSSGAALPGVTVTIENEAQSVSQSTITTETGAFRFANLAIGTYRATFELTGFKKLVLEQVIVALGASTDLQPKLDISKVQETVTVSGVSPVVETSAVRTGQTFSREQLEGLPTARHPWVILEMTPGLVMTQQNVGGNKSGQQSGFVSHGGAQGNAMWNVDGVTITDMAATGSSPTYFNFDAFQEMQITTGGNDASMQTGGVNLNMVTKSGGNIVRGSARLFVTDQQFQANNSTPALRAQGAGSGNPIQNIRDYGAEVGGPLLREQGLVLGRVRQAGHQGRRDRLQQADARVQDDRVVRVPPAACPEPPSARSTGWPSGSVMTKRRVRAKKPIDCPLGEKTRRAPRRSPAGRSPRTSMERRWRR